MIFGVGIMLRKWLVVLTALAGIAPTAAWAEWKEATSPNFQVFSEGGEAQLREFTTKLEKFNYVLRLYHNVTAPPSPIKLKVYLLPSIAAVERWRARRASPAIISRTRAGS
jgi:hypothetical protein